MSVVVEYTSILDFIGFNSYSLMDNQYTYHSYMDQGYEDWYVFDGGTPATWTQAATRNEGDVAEISILLSKQGNVKVPQDIGVMSCKAGLMLRQAIGAYTGRDVETAHAVINLDDEVDELFQQIKSELIEEVAENKDEADSSIDFIIIAKYLERVADHAVNIAQWAIFCVTGEL